MPWPSRWTLTSTRPALASLDLAVLAVNVVAVARRGRSEHRQEDGRATNAHARLLARTVNGPLSNLSLRKAHEAALESSLTLREVLLP